MKWLYPITMAIIAVYMWKIDQGNSNTAIAISIVSAVVCFVLEFRGKS